MVVPTTSTHSQADKLSIQEKLLLSQAIHKLGAISWPAISKLISSHPCCLNRPSELFTPESCETIYMELMAGLKINVPAPDAMKPLAQTHKRLAQTYYLKRMEELQQTILQYENRFKELMIEITSLKNGEADENIRSEIRTIIARKYGKKLLDSWFPEPEVVKKAIEDGPITEEEKVKAEAEKDAKQDDQIPVDGEKAVEDEVVMAETEEPSITKGEDSEGLEKDKEEEEEEEEEEDDDEDIKSERNAKSPSVPKSKVKTQHRRRFSPAVSVRSDLSPAPGSDLSSPPSDHATPEATEETAPKSTRSNKRKASVPLKGAPAPKRSGRRSNARVASSPAVTHEEDEAEAEAEEKDQSEEEDENVPRTRRGTRRESTRNLKASPEVVINKKSSPTVSRRAASVQSSTRSTPAPIEERRSGRRSMGTKGGRGMRDDVVSKSVREQSAALDSDEGQEEDAEEEEEKKPIRSSARRGRPTEKERERAREKEKKEKEKEKETPVPSEKRGTRASARTVRDQSENDQASNSAADISGDFTIEGTPASTTNSIRGGGGQGFKPTPSQKSSQKLLYSLLDTISQHRNGNVFQNPVKKTEASDYHQIIKRPMDLKTIRARIKEGHITGIENFERDVLLIFANAMMYNKPGSQVYEMAQEMLKATEDHIAHFKNLQHHVNR
uniref:Bromo domain-containing protein n=1 Tax=Kwoniella pini CBS 10737 TaxID=1296096 RepID=A0A1B9I0H5_9TREE|nr:uncharacterized protein I206_04701 [Kwoniella pini CBS 10737]OCF49014.1 hypothetical protein I206_04701 [Kwoniella pini CBS 10737]